MWEVFVAQDTYLGQNIGKWYPRRPRLWRGEGVQGQASYHNTISAAVITRLQPGNCNYNQLSTLQHLAGVIESSGYQENCTKCVMLSWSVLLFQSTDNVSPEHLTNVIRIERRGMRKQRRIWVAAHSSSDDVWSGEVCVMCTGVWLFYVNCCDPSDHPCVSWIRLRDSGTMGNCCLLCHELGVNNVGNKRIAQW